MVNFKEISTDWNDAEESSFTPLPAGEYKLYAESAELKNTKKGGQMLSFKFKVCEGQQYAGRVVFMSYNIVCPTSLRAEQIGKGQLNSLATAICGKKMSEVESSEELLFTEFLARVKVKDDQNEITSYKAIDKAEAKATRPTPVAKNINSSTEEVPF